MRLTTPFLYQTQKWGLGVIACGVWDSVISVTFGMGLEMIIGVSHG